MPVIKEEVPRFEQGESLSLRVELLRNYLQRLQDSLNYILQQLETQSEIEKTLDDKLTAAQIDTQQLNLWGELDVYADASRAVKGGSLGYMNGVRAFADGTTESTAGMALLNETESATHYVIVTEGGVRMTEHSGGNTRSAYLAGGEFRIVAAMLRATGGAQLQGDAYLNAQYQNGAYSYSGMTHAHELTLHDGNDAYTLDADKLRQLLAML